MAAVVGVFCRREGVCLSEGRGGGAERVCAEGCHESDTVSRRFGISASAQGCVFRGAQRSVVGLVGGVELHRIAGKAWVGQGGGGD